VKLGKLVGKNLLRHPLRTLLTVGGVALAMTLLLLVESMRAGLDRAFQGTEAARTLIVYRQNRYCPQTSNLPEWYTDRIAALDGVESVLPVKVYLNNCRASLDIVAFQGAPADRLLQTRKLEVLEGDAAQFRREADAALVGRGFAARKGLSVGDKFRFGDIQVKVAGIFASAEPVEEEVVLTHLEFLQRAGPVNRLGTVTQFEVKLEDAAQARAVAEQIDALFRTAEEPTDTRPKILYLESATRDLREVLRFARVLGLACVLVILSLVGNTTFMSVQERAREFGVFRTLGFRSEHLLGLVLGEATLVAFLGGVLGLAGTRLLLATTGLSIGAEGVVVEFLTPLSLVVQGMLLALAAGALAGLVPAIRSVRAEVVESLRSVAV
jgi:putative ABC transport system permease protein